MKSIYKTYKGYGFRVHRAKQIIMKIGADKYADYSERTLDNCFENYDGSAVVFALMHDALNGNDLLLQGIQNMGLQMFEDWIRDIPKRPHPRR